MRCPVLCGVGTLAASRAISARRLFFGSIGDRWPAALDRRSGEELINGCLGDAHCLCAGRCWAERESSSLSLNGTCMWWQWAPSEHLFPYHLWFLTVLKLLRSSVSGPNNGADLARATNAPSPVRISRLVISESLVVSGMAVFLAAPLALVLILFSLAVIHEIWGNSCKTAVLCASQGVSASLLG